MTKLPLCPHHSLHVTQLSRSYLEFRPWKPGVQTTWEAGDRYLGVESSRLGHGFHGDPDYHAGQGWFWLRQRTSYGDQGMFPALLQRSTPGLRLTRTKLLTKWTTSSSGHCAPISARHLTGGRTERNWMNSVSPWVNLLTF